MTPIVYVGLWPIVKNKFLRDIPKVRRSEEKAQTSYTPAVGFKQVIQSACLYFDVTQDQLESPSRKKEIANARQIVMYILYRSYNMSLVGIGGVFGRHHATVIHSIRTVENLFDTDREYNRQVVKFINQL